jgi:GTP-binding protein
MAVRAIEAADAALVLLDASEGFTDQDARVLLLVRERGRPCVLLANKWDRRADCAERAASPMAPLHARRPVLRISAKIGAGVGRLRARRIHEAAQRRIGTAELNCWSRAGPRTSPPWPSGHAAPGCLPAMQTATRPPTVLFCTEPSGAAGSSTPEKRLRETFDFEGTPVRLRLRARHEPRAR